MLSRKEIETIERFLMGEADKDEAGFVRSLFMDGENNKALLDYLSDDWARTLADGNSSGYDLTGVLERIHSIIEAREQVRRQKKIRQAILLYQRIAAFAFIPLLLIGVYFSVSRGESDTENREEVSMLTINAPLGSRVAFILPDSTRGMLNSGSSLSYSIPFETNRRVELEGEAWFEVAKLENSQFEVSSGLAEIRVLGTKFNISSYPGENYMELVLDEGRVEVINTAIDERIIMEPSERLVLQEGKSSIRFVETEKYTAWTEGELIFRGDLMPEVSRRIERWYNVEITVVDEEINGYSFRGTFKDDSLEEVLRFLCLTSPINYEINYKGFTRDGINEKTRVKIFKTK